MSMKRWGVLGALVIGLVSAVGAAQAGASSSPQSLAFLNVHIRVATVGYDPAAGPSQKIGAMEAFTGQIENSGAQFGKPSGTIVGRLEIECTVLANPADGICEGIMHVPNGVFTFAGNGPFTNSYIRHYAITGGIGPYANARGELTTLTSHGLGSVSRVTFAP